MSKLQKALLGTAALVALVVSGYGLGVASRVIGDPVSLALTGLVWAMWVVAVLVLERSGTTRRGGTDAAERLRDKSRALQTALAETELAAAELRDELDELERARDVLEGEADRQRRFLEVNREQAEKIRLLLDDAAAGRERAQRRREWLFLALGVPLGVAINALWDLIKGS